MATRKNVVEFEGTRTLTATRQVIDDAAVALYLLDHLGKFNDSDADSENIPALVLRANALIADAAKVKLYKSLSALHDATPESDRSDLLRDAARIFD